MVFNEKGFVKNKGVNGGREKHSCRCELNLHATVALDTDPTRINYREAAMREHLVESHHLYRQQVKLCQTASQLYLPGTLSGKSHHLYWQQVKYTMVLRTM